ncbi:MAG: hypothetical protein WCV68_01095 [Candidatus Paceibacterota bacterium]|jgi:hypothetical protein
MAVIELEKLTQRAPTKEENRMFTDNTLDEVGEIRKVFLAVAEEKLPDSPPDGFTVLGNIEDARLRRLWLLMKSKAQQMENWVKPDSGQRGFSVTSGEISKLDKELVFIRQLFWLELQMLFPQLDRIILCPSAMIKGWQVAIKYPERDPVDELAT